MSPGVIHASTAESHEPGYERLEHAVSALLDSIEEEPKPEVLWRLHYQRRGSPANGVSVDGGQISIPGFSSELVLDDAVLDHVKQAWRTITGEDDNEFMKFNAREAIDNDG